MADTYLTFSGLYHLVLETVSACIGGLDCGDYVVDTTGSINVPFGSDSGGLMTPTYLSGLSPYTGESSANVYFDDGTGSAWYTVPVVIGQAYNSDGQGMRALAENDTKTPIGPAIGMQRRSHKAALIVSNIVTLNIGTDFGSTLQPVTFTYGDLTTALPATTMFTGVFENTLNGNEDYDSRLSWRINRPTPGSVCAYNTFTHTQER